MADPIPSLPDTERRTTYSVTTTTAGPFNVGFDIYGNSTDYENWVEVWLDGVRIAYDDATHGWVLDSPSGTLSTLTRPITDARITFNADLVGTVGTPIALQIVGARRPRQTSQFGNTIPPRDINQRLTDISAVQRETWDRFTRLPLAPPGETMADLPPAASRANHAAFFNADGDMIASSDAPSSVTVASVIEPFLAASTLAAARKILGVQGVGVYLCTATYSVSGGGHGQYQLTTTDLSPTSLTDGTRFRFVASDTADTGLIDIGLVSPATSYLPLLGPDGGQATFFDISEGETVTVEYDSAVPCFRQVRHIRSQVLMRDGSLNIAANGTGTGSSTTSVTVQPSKGAGNIILKNPTTGSFWACHLNGGFTQNLFDGSAYVDGVANQSLSSDTFYYVYAFNYDGSNNFAVALDFIPVAVGSPTTKYPTRGELGFDVMHGDASRRHIGQLYTLNGGVGFEGLGNTPQVLVHSIYDPTLLPVQSGDISHTISSINTWEDVANAAITVCFSAVTCLPLFISTASCPSAAGRTRLKVAGISVAAGTATSLSATSSTVYVGSGGSGTSLYGQALADGWATVTPQVYSGGTNAFDVDHVCHAWQ